MNLRLLTFFALGVLVGTLLNVVIADVQERAQLRHALAVQHCTDAAENLKTMRQSGYTQPVLEARYRQTCAGYGPEL